MPDLGHTQAEWTRWLGREEIMLKEAPIYLLREIEGRFRLKREQVLVEVDHSAYLDGEPSFTGVNPGVNCSARGKVWIRVADDGEGASYTVSVYKAAGANSGDLVAQGSAAPEATVTLAEQNDSGLSGTWPLPAAVTVVAADTLTVTITPDYRVLLPRVLDGTEADDAHSSAVLTELYDLIGTRIGSLIGEIKAQLLRTRTSDGRANPKARANEFLVASETTMLTDTIDPAQQRDGVVRRVRGGLSERARLAMAGETTGGEQSVVKRAQAAPSITFSGDNTGKGSMSATVPGEAALAGVAEFFCVDSTIGAERFNGRLTVTEGGYELPPIDLPPLRIGKQWTGPFQLGPYLLERTYTKTDSGGAMADASTASVTNPTAQYTDDGNLHWEVEAEDGGSTFTISFYRSSSMQPSQLVSQATGVAASAAFQATPMNSSGIYVDWTASAGIADADTGILHINPFRTQNANGQPDSFRMVFSQTSKGLIQSHWTREYGGAVLNSATSGSETIPDDYLKVGQMADYHSAAA